MAKTDYEIFLEVSADILIAIAEREAKEEYLKQQEQAKTA